MKTKKNSINNGEAKPPHLKEKRNRNNNNRREMKVTKKEELTRVQRDSDNKYNFIDANGNEQLFDRLDNFKDGFARVQRGDGLWNFINKDGKLLSNEWFGYVDYFKNGLARVQRKEDKKCNYINKNGKIISDEWFNRVFDFKDGFAVVERTNGEFCKINKTGKIVGLSK